MYFSVSEEKGFWIRLHRSPQFSPNYVHLKMFAVLDISASCSLGLPAVDIALVAWIIEQRTDMPFLALL